MELVIETPRKLTPLLNHSRYLAAHGGRGGAKSHFFAEKLIDRCLGGKTRAACIREVQGTLKDSVRQLLVDKIAKFGVEHLFDVLENEIRGVKGTQTEGSLIIFKGMQSYNAANIKSLEDFDVAWVEEAQTFSETSLRMLRPTIRKEGSELWFSWNPRFETDAVDKFFRGKKPVADAIVVEVNWHDNPWFPEVLRKEKDADYETDPEMADHVWGGGYERVSAGAYFAKHVAKLETVGRVGHKPYDPELGPVYTSWDLGVDDYTVVWFAQIYHVDYVPRVRFIDYYEASGLGAEDIVRSGLPEYTKDLQDRAEAMVQLGRTRSYVYQRHFFPHDIGMREWGAGAKTRVQTVNALGIPFGSINRGVAQNPEERINAVRQLLPLCEFNQTERVMLGLSHLRRYSRKVNEQLKIYMGPLHDEHSHGADAFGEFAINCGVRAPDVPETELEPEEDAETFYTPPPLKTRGRGR